MRISDWSSDVCSSDLAAYKERGALNALLLLDDEAKSRGVIAASAGNHAQGLAYHGKRLGVPVTIVMPKTTPQVKVSQTASHGAEIVLFGEKFDDASAHARVLEKERGLTFVHPFDHPHIAAGQRSEEHTSELQSLMRISYAV